MMPIENAIALMILAGLVGYMVGLFRAKRFMRQEAERIADELFAKQEENTKARMQ